nr:Gag-Pol polyprotein [Tanacetum cinerariifolium]
MEAGSKDRPPMLAHDWTNIKVPVSEGSPITTTERIRETYKNVLQDIRDQLNAEAEAVQIILTGIDNDIYSTVDACPNACEMWKAIERLKQGESINVQDLETNLYWEFGKFTSQDGESLESYYLRSYKMMNELIRNQCKSQELKTVSYHKLYDILKQHQHEVNEIRAEKIARVANPLALVAQQQTVYHPQNHPTQEEIDQNADDNDLAKERELLASLIEKLKCESVESVYGICYGICDLETNLYWEFGKFTSQDDPSMVAEDEETSKDKEIDKLMALISLSFKKIYKPTNNNLRTSSNTSRTNQDNSPRINRSAGYENQKNGNVARARENVARERQKPKRAKDAAYHREKMLLCKQEEAGIQLNAEQANWRDDTDDDELEDQELEAHY